MMEAICSGSGILIPITEMETMATLYTAFKNPLQHKIWLTLEPRERPNSLQPESKLTMLNPGECKEVAFRGWITQGESTLRMRGGPYGYTNTFRVSVFHAKPEWGAVPDYHECFPVRAFAPRGASETSRLVLAISVGNMQE